MTNQYRKRRQRQYQDRCRGTVSPTTRYENALVVLAYERGDISEGRAAKALGLDRLDFRALREYLIAESRRTAFMDLEISGTFEEVTAP